MHVFEILPKLGKQMSMISWPFSKVLLINMRVDVRASNCCSWCFERSTANGLGPSIGHSSNQTGHWPLVHKGSQVDVVEFEIKVDAFHWRATGC